MYRRLREVAIVFRRRVTPAGGVAYQRALPAALPLDPVGDRVQVIARVPPGHHAVLLHGNAKGKVKALPVRPSPADGYTRLVFPAEEGRLAALEPGVPGTEFVLVCAAETADALEDLELLVGSRLAGAADSTPGSPGARLPPLPPTTLIWLGRDEPRRQTTPLRSAEEDPVAAAEYKLDQLRQQLRDRKLSVFRGVAYRR